MALSVENLRPFVHNHGILNRIKQLFCDDDRFQVVAVEGATMPCKLKVIRPLRVS